VTAEGPVQADAAGQATAGKPKRSRAKSTPGATASAGADPGPSKEPPSPGRKRKSSPTPRPKRIPANDPETSFKDIGNEIRKDPGSFGRERDQNLHPSTQKREQIHGSERKGSGEDSETSPLSIPKYGVDMPWTGARRQRDSKGHLRNKSSELGYERDAGKFWREYDHTFDNHLSAEQKKRVAEGHSPVVDDHWIKTFPEHAPFRDQVLTHHHVGQGSFAVPLPEGIHRAHSGFHPDRAVVGTPKRQTSSEEAQKILQKQQERVGGRQERELQRHAKEGRFNGWGYGKGTVPPTKGNLPLASPMAGMSEEEIGALPGASKRFSGSSAPAKSQAQQEAPPPHPQHPATASPEVSHVAAQTPPHPVDSQRVQAPTSTTHAGSSTPAPAGAATQSAASVSKSPAPATHAPPPPSHEGTPDQHGATRSVNASRGGGLLLGPNQRGVQANAGVAATQRSANGVQTGQTVNVGGKMWAKVEEVPLSSPPRFHVTVTVDLTAEGGVSAGKEGQGGGAAGVNASISAQLTWATTTAEISAEDAKVYLGSLQSGTGNAPEMNLARMISRGRIPDAKAYLARLKGLTKSADAAAHAEEGEGATFTQATQGSVGAHASKGPVGAEFSVSKSKQLQISRVKKNGKVYVSVSILGETGKHLGGSLNIANTSFGVNHTAAVSQSKGATFVLDPKAADFKSRYDGLMAVDTVEDLNRVIGANKPVEEITGKGTSHESGVKASVLGGGFAFGEGGSLKHEDIKNEDGSITHRVEGSGTGSAAFVAGDKTAAKYSQTDTFTGEVGSDNVGAGETRTARSETDLAKSASKFYSSLKKDTFGTLAGLPKGQTPILQEKNDADGKFLDDDAFGHLYELSKDARAWSQHCNRPADLIEWNQLGAKIASSGGDRAKIQALMAGFESRGTDRNKYINQAVGLSGESYQFPDSLAELEPTYRELVRGNPVAHANELIAAGKNGEATAELTTASGKLTQMLKSIRDHSGDFQHNPEAYASMQEAINRKLGEIRTAMRKATPAPPKQAQIGAQTPEQAQMDAEAEKKTDAKAKTEDDIARKVDDCQGNRKVESEMFAAIRSEFAKDNEEWYHFSKSDIYVINDKLSRLKELYARWDLTVNDLRDLYEAHGESPDRAGAYKPDRGTYNDLHKKANGAYGGY
jgi:HNH/Endo VII superfamily nuclease toxin with a HHH motif